MNSRTPVRSSARSKFAARAALFLSAAFGTTAGAQPCSPQWNGSVGTGPGKFNVQSALVADIDGPAGDGAVLVIGTDNGVLVRRGKDWSPIGLNTNGAVRALAVFDFDGNGPLAPQLVAAGLFTSIGGVPVERIARWTGAAWEQLGDGLADNVFSLVSYDADGEGPQPPRLIAGGRFFNSGAASIIGAAQWTGNGWTQLGGGLNAGVNSLTLHDPDGNGPQPPVLIAVGGFSTADGLPIPYHAIWNGSVWSSLSAPGNSRLTAVVSHDPDGGGPLNPQLVCAMITYSSPWKYSVIRWEGGNAWTQLGNPISDTVNVLGSCDPDGNGPLPAELVAGADISMVGGIPPARVIRWNGAAWEPLGPGTTSFPTVITAYDADGDGRAEILVGSQLLFTSPPTESRLACWSGSGWLPLDGGVTALAEAFTSFDPDGSGPQPPQLIAGGQFTVAGGVPANFVARFDGERWSALGAGLNGEVFALTSHDPDGPGPLPPRLIAGGSFTGPGAASPRFVAQWNGSSWESMGAGMDNVTGFVRALTSFDPDGDGPQPPQLIAGGDFNSSGSTPLNYVARWDGTAWQPLGAGMNNSVRALATFDPDGDGPQAPQLIAGGTFESAGGTTARSIARWNGQSWSSIGFVGGANTGTSGVSALTSFDPDGPGPLTPLLVAGGNFSYAGNVSAKHVALYDGTQWQPLGNGASLPVTSVAAFDPDESGPQPPVIVVGQAYFVLSPNQPNRLIQWNGSSWSPLGGGTTQDVHALWVHDLDGRGPQLNQLIAGGYMWRMGSFAAPFVAAYGCLTGDQPGPCGPADIGSAGGLPGSDAQLDNNDFIVFINSFFLQAPSADTGGAGGLPGPDGQLDNNDFIVFINQFFDGC